VRGSFIQEKAPLLSVGLNVTFFHPAQVLVAHLLAATSALAKRRGGWERLWRTYLAQLDYQWELEWSKAFLEGTFLPVKRGAKR